MTQLYFVAGASGSGKSSIKDLLKQRFEPSLSIYDFDEIGVPSNADKMWRHESTEKWLQRLIKEGKDACLLGQTVLGEILACPSADKLKKIHFCLLDTSDAERHKRLLKREGKEADPHMLNWAAWLREHHQNPQWNLHVIQEGSWPFLNFKRWKHLESWETLADVMFLDSTELTVSETAESVAEWIERGQKRINRTLSSA